MTNLNIRRVQFLNQAESLATISEETGIPRSSLSYIARGERNLPKIYQTPLSNYYRRQAYSRLRDVGLSSVQANRFRWYAPEKVLGVENTMREKIQELTLGVMAARSRKEGHPLDARTILKDFQKEAAKMIEAIQKSPKTLEQIEKYGTYQEQLEKETEGLEEI